MKALCLRQRRLCLRDDVETPTPGPGDVLVRVLRAGICSTDAALQKGMYTFEGVLGHEFVGIAESGPGELQGRRVVGEINIACGVCDACRANQRKHCLRRAAAGIRGRDGAFAEFIALPVENLHLVPDAVSDEAAVFTEPLAAAMDVLEQVTLEKDEPVLVVGDGKLAQLMCRVLGNTGAPVDVAGKHARKLAKLDGIVDKAFLNEKPPSRRYHLVVECTGQPSGLSSALDAVKTRGTVVIKSTYAQTAPLDCSRIVVDELRLLGSRCGPFEKALALLASGRVDPLPLIDARFPLDDAVEAMQKSREPGVMKVLLAMDDGAHPR